MNDPFTAKRPNSRAAAGPSSRSTTHSHPAARVANQAADHRQNIPGSEADSTRPAPTQHRLPSGGSDGHEQTSASEPAHPAASSSSTSTPPTAEPTASATWSVATNLYPKRSASSPAAEARTSTSNTPADRYATTPADVSAPASTSAATAATSLPHRACMPRAVVTNGMNPAWIFRRCRTGSTSG